MNYSVRMSLELIADNNWTWQKQGEVKQNENFTGQEKSMT